MANKQTDEIPDSLLPDFYVELIRKLGGDRDAARGWMLRWNVELGLPPLTISKMRGGPERLAAHIEAMEELTS